jgi:transposase
MSRAGEKRIPKRCLEDTRRLVAHAVEQGMHPDEAAEVFDVGRSTVYNWVKQFRENGAAAFRVKKATGRSRKLSDKQMAQLRSIIVGREPRQLQLDFALWTRELVREVIRRKFGVTYTLPAVGNILHDLACRRSGHLSVLMSKILSWCVAGRKRSTRPSTLRPKLQVRASSSATSPGSGPIITPARHGLPLGRPPLSGERGTGKQST